MRRLSGSNNKTKQIVFSSATHRFCVNVIKLRCLHVTPSKISLCIRQNKKNCNQFLNNFHSNSRILVTVSNANYAYDPINHFISAIKKRMKKRFESRLIITRFSLFVWFSLNSQQRCFQFKKNC